MKNFKIGSIVYAKSLFPQMTKETGITCYVIIKTRIIGVHKKPGSTETYYTFKTLNGGVVECRHSDMFSSRKAAFDSLYSTLILRAEEATVYDADTTLELTNN